MVKFLILSAAFLLCAGCGNRNAGKQGSGSPLSEEISKSIDVENVARVNIINGSSGDIIKITDLDKINVKLKLPYIINHCCMDFFKEICYYL